MNKNNLTIINKDENIIVNSYKCKQTKGIIDFCHVDGNVEMSEFHFYSGTDIVSIGKYDLFTFLEELKLPNNY